MKISGSQRDGYSIFDLDMEMGRSREDAIETGRIFQGISEPNLAIARGDKRGDLPDNLTNLDRACLMY